MRVRTAYCFLIAALIIGTALAAMVGKAFSGFHVRNKAIESGGTGNTEG